MALYVEYDPNILKRCLTDDHSHPSARGCRRTYELTCRVE